jgi:hypothetical protein
MPQILIEILSFLSVTRTLQDAKESKQGEMVESAAGGCGTSADSLLSRWLCQEKSEIGSRTVACSTRMQPEENGNPGGKRV